MTTEIHITADKDVWTGASTTALLAAKAANGIVISAGDDTILQRLRREEVEVVTCPMSGIFGSLNLSRALRHIPGNAFDVYVHTPSMLKTVASAIKLVGRPEPMTLHQERPEPEFPPVEVEKPADGQPPLLMWLGNITADCGLRELIETLGTKADKQWRLRVVGQGQAKIVSPILKRTKALDISDRIEWIGYAANPYAHMNGVSAAIVPHPDSIVAREFAAASIPVYTNLSQIL